MKQLTTCFFFQLMWKLAMHFFAEVSCPLEFCMLLGWCVCSRLNNLTLQVVLLSFMANTVNSVFNRKLWTCWNQPTVCCWLGVKKETEGICSCFAFNHLIEKVFQIYFEHNIQYNTIHCVKHWITHLQQLVDLEHIIDNKKNHLSCR